MAPSKRNVSPKLFGGTELSTQMIIVEINETIPARLTLYT